MTLMLASIKNADEAAQALACGVDWIDVKDPAAGALGAAPLDTVAAVVRAVAGRCPVSATIGDCWDTPEVIESAVITMSRSGIDFVKAGLSARNVSDATCALLGRAAVAGAGLILVCKAEAAPDKSDIKKLASCGIEGIMLDTADKTGKRLVELLTVDELRDFVHSAKACGLLTGLAGRMQTADVARLVDCGADYLGFRSALCRNAQRDASVDPEHMQAVRNVMQDTFGQSPKRGSEVA